MTLAPAELAPTELLEEAIATRSTVNTVDFSQEIDLLSLQSAKDEPIVSDSGSINFAALYLETARKGPTKVLQAIRR